MLASLAGTDIEVVSRRLLAECHLVPVPQREKERKEFALHLVHGSWLCSSLWHRMARADGRPQQAESVECESNLPAATLRHSPCASRGTRHRAIERRSCARGGPCKKQPAERHGVLGCNYCRSLPRLLVMARSSSAGPGSRLQGSKHDCER